MPLKRFALMLLLVMVATAYQNSLAGRIRHIKSNKPVLTDSILSVKNQYQLSVIRDRAKKAFAGNCYDINWATWSTFSDVSSTTGSIIDADGSQIGITMSANYTFGSTPSIYTFSRFSGYPASIPNTTVPKTTWSAGTGGSTDMCFSKKVTNPVLLLSSLGSTQPTSSQLKFSIPYVVLYDGGGMVYNDSKTITGTEGYAIIMFPGDFNCVNIQSNTPENYTNLTWGIRPQPFAVTITDNSSTCGSTKVTASGGVSYHWDGGDTPNQATNTFHQSGNYLVTVTNASGCVTSASKTIVVSTTIAPVISAFSIPQQSAPAILDAVNKKITITMPYGTDLTTLRPIVTIPANTTVSPASGAVVNFINPVNYTITNSCAQVSYMVTVKIDNTIPVTQRLACPADAVLLNGDVLATPPNNYAWQVIQAGVWVNAAGTINQANYTATAPANLTGSNIMLDYRRAVTKGGSTVYDSYYRLTVTPSTDQNTITVDRQVACGTVTKLYNFTGNRPIGYTALTRYQWQTSADGVNWQDEANVTGESWGLNAQITAKTWFRRVSVTGLCKAYSNVINIDHIPGPGPATVGPPVTLCNVTEYTLTGNIPAADETGSWSVISTTGYNPFTPANIHDPHAHITALPLNSTFDFIWTLSKASCDQIYSATVTITNGVTSTITDFFVPEQDAPTVIDQLNHTITLSVSPKVDRSHLMGLVTVDNGTVSPSSGTTQDFTGVVNYRLTNQCSFVDYKVTINQATPTIIHICQNENNVLLPAVGASGATYQWERYQGGVWQPAAGNNTGADYIAAFTGSPSVTAIDSYRRKTTAGGVITYQFYYDVYFDPSVSNNQVAADNILICQGGTQLVNLTGNIASSAGGNVTYQWRVSTDNANWQSIDNATQKDYHFVFSDVLTKYYSRVATFGGCSVVSNIIRVDYAGNVTTADAGMAQSICSQAQLTLNANMPKPFEVGTWSVVNPAEYNPFNSGNLHNPNAVISDLPYDVNIILKWRIEQTACGLSSENMVTVRNYSQPVVSAGSSVTIDRGTSTVLNGSVSAGNYTYVWSPATGLNDPGVLHPVASPGETTVYTLTAKNGLDCIQQATVKVIVNNELGIPSTITPNDDSINDTWTIKNIDDHAAEVQIFDRAGRQVFYSKGYGKKWDATYNGKKLPAAVYYYIIRLNDIKVIKKGWVTVIY
ncbi:gliding motility-associated C-terminal domain-containing protein [Mucilaginibacter rigui]|uniref:Gliding motility-associated C-terminal domain-containing protein n=1 Tax=Mucilaginibacter rigui TaxID=534635 RepID=A0ABR7X9M9_9SPHI|nr:gliding motility-associated C-terminal domain-containing protein [Mucilaginibacter rigui]MBD1387234.1 gliding motility-associated C-terminal domain-containing protein [Mucilaginibacter rigui]